MGRFKMTTTELWLSIISLQSALLEMLVKKRSEPLPRSENTVAEKPPLPTVSVTGADQVNAVGAEERVVFGVVREQNGKYTTSLTTWSFNYPRQILLTA